MEPIQIALVVLAIVGVWAVVELALTLRRARGVVSELDKTVDELNSTLEEARPVVAKLDGAIDDLQPALTQVEPLLKQANIAVEALSADLIEVNGVLRDVSAVSGAASSASSAVSGLADAASDKVQRLFGKGRKSAVPNDEPVLPEAAPAAALEGGAEDTSLDEESVVPEPRSYFTYSDEETTHE